MHLRPLHNSSPWMFQFPEASDHYVDLPSTRLYIKFKVTNADGSDTIRAANFAVCNLPGSSLISRIDVLIGGRTIPDLQTMHYNYKSYIETILSYSASARSSQLRCSGFFVDTAGKYEDFKQGKYNDTTGVIIEGEVETQNQGYFERRALLRRSRPMETVAPIQSDFFQVIKYNHIVSRWL